jgi:hypothetical protein
MIAAMVMTSVISSASSFGSQRCKAAWHGQTSAMMNKENINGAKIDCAT